MKKILLAGAILALAAYCVLLVVFTASPIRFYGDGTWFPLPCDMKLVVAENECLLKGVDPYDVFKEKVKLSGYISQYPSSNVQVGDVATEMCVGVNPPWVYTAFMPFSLLSHRGASAVWFCIKFLCLGVLLLWGVRIARRTGRDKEEALIVGVSAVLAIALPAFQDFLSMNWALVTVVATMLMATCLNGGRDILAGVCWAFVMLKPQIGLAFAIPLLMMGRFKACLAAVATCFVASIPPSLMCGKSPVEMILAISGAYTRDYWGCGTMPHFLVDILSQGLAIPLGLVAGAIVCALMVWVMREEKNWFFLLMPAAVCSVSWTYARCYSHVMTWFFFICLAVVLAGSPRSKALWLMAIASLLLPTRLWNMVHMLPEAMPSVIPKFLPSEAWHFHIDTLNSTLDLALAFWLCLFCRSRAAQANNLQSKCI